jgi:hypothetical protein
MVALQSLSNRFAITLFFHHFAVQYYALHISILTLPTTHTITPPHQTLTVFPWCLFTMLLREVALDMAASRILIPILSIIFISRAVLGPTFVVKLYMSGKYLFNPHFKVRNFCLLFFTQSH